MTREALQQYLHAKPDEPCVLHLTGRRRLTVAHPDNIGFSPARVSQIVVTIPDGTFEFVDLKTIISVARPAT